MEGVEKNLNPQSFIFAKQLGVSVVVTDQQSAMDSIYFEDTKVASRTIVRQVAICSFAVACTEHLVVTINDLAHAVDDVKAIVGLVPSSQAM